MAAFDAFDVVGRVALELERMAGFNHGQRDFAAGTAQTPDKDLAQLTRMEAARLEGYIQGWMGSYAAFCKQLTDKGLEV